MRERMRVELSESQNYTIEGQCLTKSLLLSLTPRYGSLLPLFTHSLSASNPELYGGEGGQMAATTLFSATKCPHHYPISPPHLASSSNSNKSTSSATLSTKTSPKPPLILLRALSSSSISTSNPTSTTQKQEEEDGSSSPSTSDSVTQQSNSINSIPLGGCKACGKAEIERGCNGDGRIQGGIATVPGFGWWPIKAYRPCPGFVATGGRYRRQGQSMDEVAGFGNAPRASSKVATTKTQSSTKESPRKLQEVKRASKK